MSSICPTIPWSHQVERWIRNVQELYLILSVDPAASRDEIEAAYLRKIQQVPKTGVRGWLVRALNMNEPIEYARRVLVSPEMRHRYDLYPEEFDGFPTYCAGY